MFTIATRRSLFKAPSAVLKQTTFVRNPSFFLATTSFTTSKRTFFGGNAQPSIDEKKASEAAQAFINKISQYPNVVEKFSEAQQVFASKSIGAKNFETMSAWQSLKFLLDPEIKQAIKNICDEMKKSNVNFDKEEVQSLMAAINSSMGQTKK
ncbi:hypothetical protein ACO0RG_003928 [Hanseniaspora osmophila]|uniref:Uncharacterized protein n=1 Tax=Hanseniaspora osmophila TaxID=56408 RepID=A0A1E5RAE8_9ASCO|nr:hypothetical protein AWRI3579_g2564 [Hanseniaspora osmophila]